MSNENFEMSPPSPTDQIDYRKHRGVRTTKSGKWGAAIRHPITKVSVWLGSYNTPKEAADAYNKKQLEYQSLAVRKTKGYVKRKSSIQGAKIQDIGIYEPVCLVTCNYAEDSVIRHAAVEETEDTLSRKMCEANFLDQVEINSTESKLHGKEDAVAHNSEMTNHLSADLAEAVGKTKVAIRAKRLSGSGSIYRKKSGRWQARICYRKSKFHVGIFSTYEEAEAALDKKRQELDSVACVEVVATEPVNRELTCNQTPEKQESITTPCCEEDLAQEVSNTDVAISVKRLAGSGSISQKEGKWQARISSGNSRVYLGVYDTYEEAEAAIHKKRQDLESLARGGMAAEEDKTTTETTSGHSVALACNQDPQNQISVIRPCGVYQRKSGRWFAEIKNPVTKWRGSVGTYDTAEQAFEILNRKRREFSLLNDADKKCKQTIDVTEEDLQTHSGTTANCKMESIEWKSDETALAKKSQNIEGRDCSASMEDLQAPCSSFDYGVINAYGQLVGEFSRLDDDLWLVESVDDVVQN